MLMHRFWGGRAYVSEVKIYESGFGYNLQNKLCVIVIRLVAYFYKFIINGV